MEEPAIADRAPDAVASDSASPAAGAGAGARVAPANYPSGYRAARRAELSDSEFDFTSSEEEEDD